MSIANRLRNLIRLDTNVRGQNNRAPGEDESEVVPVNQDSNVEIRRIEEFQLPSSDQQSCKLFTDLPGEVRDLIYEYVLADFEDMENEYDLHTCYRRPEYFAPRKTDTAILRTCQAVYEEAWYLPWTSSRHTFYLATETRKPEKTTTIEQMTNMLAMIEKLHPDTPSRRKEVNQIQVFAQAYLLEPGKSLGEILQIPHLMPKVVTITLRHTDMWWWEDDYPMHIKPNFVSKVSFPASVSHIEIQFESLERRRTQVDYMASRAANEWYFKRSDNVHLVARSTSVTRWTGSSTWVSYTRVGQRWTGRWIGDEEDSLPGKLSYYMTTIVFTPAHCIDDAAGYEARAATSTFKEIHVPPDIANVTRRQLNRAVIPIDRFQKLRVDDSTPASEVYRRDAEMTRGLRNIRARRLGVIPLP